MDSGIATARTSKVPEAPTTIDETGISTNNLLRIMLKAMYVRGLELGSELADEMKISGPIVQDLLDEAREQKLIETRGSVGGHIQSEIRYGLVAKGQEWAGEALELSQYIGPAPVSLSSYHKQIKQQPLFAERVEQNVLEQGLSELVIPDALVRRLGQAINSARALLLYGAPGNGKTSIATVIGELFQDVTFIPYCLEVDGNIIKVYDPSLHQRVTDPAVLLRAIPEIAGYKPRDIDERWVACRRPVVRAGGELTLEMLDLQFNPHSRFYEAPLHVKAIGGTFLIDDLGRQLVEPDHLLNRWITPMEERVDYLTLTSGRTFTVPFDVFVIFATNLTPEDLMDPAFLRRIPYKVRIKRPSPVNYGMAFRKLCETNGLAYDDSVVSFVMDKIQNVLGQPLSFYQPRFIVEQIVAACKYDGKKLSWDRDMVVDALDNISLSEGMIELDGADPAESAGSEGPAASDAVSETFVPSPVGQNP
ncbi:MAG: hypothetical protein ACE5OQ_16125 [Woeseia sp.]